MLHRLTRAVVAVTVAAVALSPLAAHADTTPKAPAIEAHVASAEAPNGGWHRGPVTVSFTCAADVQLATPCPKPAVVSRQGTSEVRGSIRIAGGGTATASVTVRIDGAAPSVRVAGPLNGATYFDAPPPTCSATDGLSGVAACTITTEQRGKTVFLAARATDLAGNGSTARVSYRLADFVISGARTERGVYQLRRQRIYPILVRGTRPRYVYATPAGVRPRRTSVPFDAAGKDRWSLGIALAKSRHRAWNIAYRQDGRLRVIRVHVIG